MASVARTYTDSPWLNWEHRGRLVGTYAPTDGRLEQILNVDLSTAAGVSVTPDRALGVSAIWRAVRLRSEAVAKLPLHIFERTVDEYGLVGRNLITDGRMAKMLRLRPNPEMSAFSFWAALVANTDQWGNGYAEIERDASGQPVNLWPIHASRVEPKRRTDADGVKRLWFWVGFAPGEVGERPDGGGVWIPARDMIHIPGLTFNGVTGLSVLGYARQSMGLTIAAEEYGAGFFGNSGRPSGVIKHPAKLSPPAAERLRSTWQANYGSGRSQGTAVLEEGMSYEQMSMPPEDAQFIETRNMQVVEVARWYGVPPHKLGHMSGATFSNIEHQASEFREDAIQPLAEKIQQEIDAKVLGTMLGGNAYAEFDLDRLVVPTMVDRADAINKLRQGGVLSTDEGRSMIGKSPLPGGRGQGTWHPVNMAVVMPDGRVVLPFRPADTVTVTADGQVAAVPAQSTAVVASGDPVSQPDPLPGPDPSTIDPSDENARTAAKADGEESRTNHLHALRPVFADVFERATARERNAKRQKKNPDAAWLAGWRDKHAAWVTDQLLAPMRSAIAAQGRRDTDGQAMALAAGVAAEWCESITFEDRTDGELERAAVAATSAAEVTEWTI